MAQHLKQVEEKIKSAITKRNAIDDFTSRKAVPRQVSESAEQPSNQQQPSGTSKLGGMPTEPLSNVRPPAPKTSVVELSPDAFAALKRQTYPKQIQAMAKEAHEQYPGVKALQERQAKELHQREVEASIENFVNKKVAEPTTEKTKTSSIDILKRMPEKMRRKLGPKFAPGLLLNVPDEQFVVYEPNADTEYRGTLTIGTDFTCRVCQSFHQLIPTLNAEGIKVRYMPYPRAEVISYDFPLNHTMDERIARIRTEPLSPHGQLITAAYCSEDNKAAYNELFRTKMLNVWPTHISKSCEGAVREFKFLGDLLFNKATPYMVWGDSETSKEQTGYIRGLLPSDRSIDDLLKRLES
ncbi:hypothetical protein OCT63_19480 [Vibrio sp. RW]|uniref:hypothetical protein n=1 Tax=Vibrio sp. RW TaxID=2998833 RepID=UPI0022CD5EB1|nr:hypothetical protein [Vibrio sp. RW]MDA0146411.1 hypothetical protein [Vibrio sp. RW]